MSQKSKPLFLILGLVGLVLIIALVLRFSGDQGTVTVVSAPVVELKEPLVKPVSAPVDRAIEEAPKAPVEVVAAVETMVVPEAVAVVEAPAQKPVLPPTMLKVLVVEETTGLKLESVEIELVEDVEVVENPFEGQGPPNGFPGFNPQPQQELNPLQAITNAEGEALLTLTAEHLKPLENKPLAIVADWGVGPRHQVPVKLKLTQENELTITYPARSEITLRLIREDESVVANFPLTMDVRQFNWNRPGGFFLTQTIRTNENGEAVFLSYPQNRTPLQVKSEELVMFKGQGRRSSDGNPMFRFGNINPDDVIEVVMIEDVVRAIGTLTNTPETLKNVVMTASVEGEEVNYMTLPVENNKVTFSAPMNQKVKLYLIQAEDQGNPVRRFQGPPPSVELKMDVTMPEKSGEYKFDIPFSEREQVIVKVYLPDGEPADGVRIRGLGFQSKEQQAAAQGQGGQGGGRGGNWQARMGRITGESSIRSEPTDQSGTTVIDVPPATSYVFQVDSDTLPEEARGVDPKEILWEEILTGKELTFTLKSSSLLWGTVQDKNGIPVANAQVNLRGPNIRRDDPLFTTRTLEDGTFELNVPPVRLVEPEEDEAPVFYVFATGRNVGGGLGKAVIDNAEEPINVTLRPYKTLRIEALNNGAPVTKLDFAQLYDVPGYDQPISARADDSREDEKGIYRFNMLIEDVSSLNLWPTDDPGASFIIIQMTSEIVNDGLYRVDFANPDKFELVEEEADETEQQGGGPGGGGPGGGRGRGGL